MRKWCVAGQNELPVELADRQEEYNAIDGDSNEELNNNRVAYLTTLLDAEMCSVPPVAPGCVSLHRTNVSTSDLSASVTSGSGVVTITMSRGGYIG